MKKTLVFFKKEFPSDVVDIKDCLDLLCQCLDSTIANVSNKIGKAVIDREFDKMSSFSDCAKKINEIQDKLEEYSALLDTDGEFKDEAVDIEITEQDEKKITNYSDYAVDRNIPYSLYDDFTHKKAAGFSLFGNRFEANDWKDIFVLTCEELAKKDIAKFNSFVTDNSMQGKKVQYFSQNDKEMRNPKKINGTDIYIMTNMCSNQIRNIIALMLRKYNIQASDYKIFLRADYTALHGSL